MIEDGIGRYIEFITPKKGDPTFSLLKAHLLFEELLRSYLAKVLPHVDALDGARLTFAQLLAVARASSPFVQPNNWIWKAMGDFNKLRNMLSHEVQPQAFAERMEAYIRFVRENSKTPLPQPVSGVSNATHPTTANANGFMLVDVVTVGLYGYASGLFGISPEYLLERDQQRQRDVEDLAPNGVNGSCAP